MVAEKIRGELGRWMRYEHVEHIFSGLIHTFRRDKRAIFPEGGDGEWGCLLLGGRVKTGGGRTSTVGNVVLKFCREESVWGRRYIWGRC